MTSSARTSRNGVEPAGRPATSALDTERTIRSVGKQIRQLRMARKLKLQDIADRTGVSISMLSMLERGVAGGSIGTLVAVSSALGVHMSVLFDADPEEVTPVKRLADQLEVVSATGVIRRLVHQNEATGVEMVVNEYAPGTSSAAGPTHHQGTELGVLLEGELVIELEGVLHHLKPGDGITYASDRPHRITNEGTTVAKTVWVNLDS